MNIRSPLVQSALLFAVLLVAGCRKSSDAPSSEDAPPPEVAVTTDAVRVGTFEESLSITGLVVPSSGTVAQVTSPVATRVTLVHVVAGQLVKAGDPLVDLDRVSIDAEVERATAVFTAADSNVRRAQRLVTGGILPRRDVEQAATDLAQAKAALRSAQRIATLSTLTAPIAGVVTRLSAIPGAVTDPALPLVEITNPDAVDIAFSIPADLASRIQPGSQLLLMTGRDTLGKASVQQVSALVDSSTHGVSVRAKGGQLKRPLRLGESVTGELRLSDSPRALMVPIEALVPAEDGFEVFVVDRNHTAHARPVEVGGRNAKTAHILAGLKASERVVTIGAFGLDDGVKVTEKSAEVASPGRP